MDPTAATRRTTVYSAQEVAEMLDDARQVERQLAEEEAAKRRLATDADDLGRGVMRYAGTALVVTRDRAEQVPDTQRVPLLWPESRPMTAAETMMLMTAGEMQFPADLWRALMVASKSAGDGDARSRPQYCALCLAIDAERCALRTLHTQLTLALKDRAGDGAAAVDVAATVRHQRAVADSAVSRALLRYAEALGLEAGRAASEAFDAERAPAGDESEPEPAASEAGPSDAMPAPEDNNNASGSHVCFEADRAEASELDG